MAELAVNLVLILAVLVLLVAWAISVARRRRAERNSHAEQRRLILAAITSAAATTAGPNNDVEPAVGCDPAVQRRADTPPVSTPVRQLDAASVAGLIALLEQRRPARRGMIASLIATPHIVWAAGAQTGRTVSRRMAGQRTGADGKPADWPT